MEKRVIVVSCADCETLTYNTNSENDDKYVKFPQNLIVTGIVIEHLVLSQAYSKNVIHSSPYSHTLARQGWVVPAVHQDRIMKKEEVSPQRMNN